MGQKRQSDHGTAGLASLSAALPSATQVARSIPSAPPAQRADASPEALPRCFAEVWRRRSSTLCVHRNERAALEAVAVTVPAGCVGDEQALAGIYLAALVVALRRVLETSNVAADVGSLYALEGSVDPPQQLSKRQRQKARRRMDKNAVIDADKMHSSVRTADALGLGLGVEDSGTPATVATDLSGEDTSSADLIASLVYLISLALHDAKAAVVKLKCEDILNVLETVARAGYSAAASRHASAAIVGVLALLDSSAWSQPTIQRAFLRVLTLCSDGNPKTRRRARDSLQALLEGPNAKMISSRTSGAIAVHIVSLLKDLQSTVVSSIDSSRIDGQSGPTKLIFLITSVSLVAPALQSVDAARVAKELVVLGSANVPHVSTFVYTALVSLFEVQASGSADTTKCSQFPSGKPMSRPSAIPTSHLGRIVAGLAEIVLPSPCHDEESVAYASCLSHGTLSYLDSHKFSPPPGNALRDSVSALVDCLDPTVTSSSVARKVTHSLTELISHRWSEGNRDVFLALQPLFGYRFKAVWETAIQPLRVFLESFGAEGEIDKGRSSFVEHVVKVRNEARQNKDRQTLTTSTGILASILRGGGLPNVLRVVPLATHEKLLLSNAWLLPLLDQHVRSSEMGVFGRELLPLADDLSASSLIAREDGRAVEGKNASMLATQIWGILPGICQSPTDLAQEASLGGIFLAFSQGLSPSVDPSLHASAIGGLRNLSVSIANLDDDNAVTRSTRKLFAKHFRALFPAVLAVVERTDSERRGSALEAVTKACAACDDPKLVTSLLRKSIRRLLEASVSVKPNEAVSSESSPMALDDSKDDSSRAQRHAAADMAIAIAESRCVPESSAEIDFLERTMSPLFLDSSDTALQKKAYRATTLLVSLGVVGQTPDSAVTFIKNTAAASSAVSSSAKGSRLGLVQALVSMSRARSVGGDAILEVCTDNFLSEVILGTRDVSEKTRVASFGALSGFAQAWFTKESDEASGLVNFLTQLSAGLAGRTVSMLAATLSSLSHVIYEFRGESALSDSLARSVDDLFCVPVLDASISGDVPESTTDAQMHERGITSENSRVEPGPVSILLRHSSREVQKAALGTIKVATLALASPPTRLCAVLPGIIPGLVGVAAKSKKKETRLRVRVILERLLRKCGREAVEAVFPENHMKLLNAVRKQHSRDVAKKHESREKLRNDRLQEHTRSIDAQHGKASERPDSDGDESDDGFDSGESDSDVEKELLDGDVLARAGGRHKRRQASELLLRDDSHVVDLLETKVADGFATRREVSDAAHRALLEQRKPTRNDKDVAGFKLAADGRPIFEESASVSDVVSAHVDAEDVVGRSRVGKSNLRKRKRAGDEFSAGAKKLKGSFGEEYRGRRGAAGDMKKPGAPDPYAYVPLGSSLAGSTGRSLVGNGGSRKGTKYRASSRSTSRGPATGNRSRGGRRGIPARR